jgi:hypothetical protein
MQEICVSWHWVFNARVGGVPELQPMMSKEDLLARLDQTLAERLKLLQSINPEAVVDDESGWRTQDVMGHLATWVSESANCLVARRAGLEYYIPNFHLEAFREMNYKKLKDNQPEEIVANWQNARARLRDLLDKLTPEQFEARLFLPTGDRGDIEDLIQDVIEREEEGFQQILAAA